MDVSNIMTNRLKEFGNWSEQISSSGKRYYYNSVSNISQWEKPPEWKQAEKLRAFAIVEKNGNKFAPRSENEKSGPTTINPETSATITKSTSTPSSTVKRPYPIMASAELDRTANNSREHPTLSTKSPVKPSSSNDANDNFSITNSTTFLQQNNSEQQQKAGMSSSLKNNTPKPRPLNSIDTSSMAIKKSYKNNVNDRVTSSLQENSTSKNAQISMKEELPKKLVLEGFREEKYQKHWRPELAVLSRRALGFDLLANEFKKCTDRCLKHASNIFSLDRDIHSIHILCQTDQLRTKLLSQRLDAVRERIKQLDSKSQ